MPWARLDDSFHDNPRVIALTDEPDGWAALGIWVFALCWAAKQGTGRVPAGLIRRAAGRETAERLAAILVRHRFWRQLDGYGWQIIPDRSLGTWVTPNWAGVPDFVREAIYERDGRACLNCGSADDLTLDHIWPRSLGGTDEVSNLQTLCRPCNSRKGATV